MQTESNSLVPEKKTPPQHCGVKLSELEIDAKDESGVTLFPRQCNGQSEGGLGCPSVQCESVHHADTTLTLTMVTSSDHAAAASP